MQSQKLKQTLDNLCADYIAQFEESPSNFFFHSPDPLLFAHRYESFHDREAAAFIAATFAYGNVMSVCRFVDGLLGLLGASPAQVLMQGPGAVQKLKAYNPYYRLHKSTQILAVLEALARVYCEHGSLQHLFTTSYYNNSTMKDRIGCFVGTLRGYSDVPLKFLIPSPDDGSPCKRLNLFLRWVVRKNGVDLGLWRDISPADLIMPADTHIGRVAYKLGWIKTPSLSWNKAERITAVLRKFDPEDPTRYDFALCHESMIKSPWLMKLINPKPQRT